MKRFYFKDSVQGYDLKHADCPEESPSNFILHNHCDSFEVLIFIKGDACFKVEGNLYTPQPFDIIITSPSEMHRMCLNRICEYDRYVMHITKDFFAKNDCSGFCDFFWNRPLGENNLIKGNKEIINLVKKMETAIKENVPRVVIKGMLVEFLFRLSEISQKPRTHFETQAHIKEILDYLNDNLAQKLNLDELAEQFFLNKYYLCHIFKKHTGLTINQYVNCKRLLLARELYAKGNSLLEASEMAGFCNYSVFYKAYKREFGAAPRQDMKYGNLVDKGVE